MFVYSQLLDIVDKGVQTRNIKLPDEVLESVLHAQVCVLVLMCLVLRCGKLRQHVGIQCTFLFDKDFETVFPQMYTCWRTIFCAGFIVKLMRPLDADDIRTADGD